MLTALPFLLQAGIYSAMQGAICDSVLQVVPQILSDEVGLNVCDENRSRRRLGNVIQASKSHSKWEWDFDLHSMKLRSPGESTMSV